MEDIYNFKIYVKKLTKLRENWLDDKKVWEFKRGVSDLDCDTEVRVHKGNFEKLIETVRKRGQDLDCTSDYRSCNNKRMRQVLFYGSDDEEADPKSSKKKTGEFSRGEKPSPFNPFIPKFLYHTLDVNAKKNFIKWRSMVNQGNTMEKKDLIATKNNDGESTKKSPKK